MHDASAGIGRMQPRCLQVNVIESILQPSETCHSTRVLGAALVLCADLGQQETAISCDAAASSPRSEHLSLGQRPM